MDPLTALLVLVVTTALSVALAPKPPKPRPASLKDFDVPVAEEGRPIPVVFGTVEVKGANVLWYGDLKSKKIKKSSLMGSQVIGFKYFLGLHFGLCHGPVDAVTRVTIGDHLAWDGRVTDNSSITIDKRGLFGGKKREGGVAGEIDFEFGADDQTTNSYLSGAIGGTLPAYRGVLGAVWHGITTGGGYIGNSPYTKPFAFTVERIVEGWSGGTAWYPEKAAIMRPGGGVLAGATCELSWWQSSWHPADNDWARMGMVFIDSNGDEIDSTYASMIGTTHFVWTQRTLSATAPSGTVKVRLVMEMERQEGTNNDGYIDDIVLTVDGQSVSIVNPGAESGSTTGWTTTSGSLAVRSTNPSPHSGSHYFFGGTSSESSSYQDVAPSNAADMNPAHILYEALTNSEWGMGVDASLIDETSWAAAADTLYAENFGLSLLWNQQSSIEAFTQEILDHIAGVIAFRPDDGTYHLKLIRGDYDPSTLPVMDESNVLALRKYEIRGWGETVNEIVVTYVDGDTGKDATITVQDIANVSVQGRVSRSTTYPGIRYGALAEQVAMRDLATVSTPLSTVELEVDRSAWSTNQGDLFKLTWPKYSISDVVYRVINITKGTLDNNTIRIDALADIYALGNGSYVSVAAALPAGTAEDEDSTESSGATVVSATTTSPPANPTDGASYYIPSGASGAWEGLDGQVATWDEEEGEWQYEAVAAGQVVLNQESSEYITLDGAGDTAIPPWPVSGIPLVEFSGDLVLDATHNGKKLVHTTGAGSGHQLTMPAGASDDFTVNVINLDSESVTIDVSSATPVETLYFAGAGTTGQRTLGAWGMCIVTHLGNGYWIISGLNVS